MKILFLIDSLGSGGAQRQIVTLSILLKKKGCDVAILTYHSDNFFIDEVLNCSIEIHQLNSKNFINRIFKVRKFIRKGNFDAVISFMDVPNFLNNLAAIGGKSWKIITSERSSKESTLTSLKGKIFSWFQRYSDYLICNSNNSKKMWLRYKPNYFNKLKVIYNPVILPELSSVYQPRRNSKLNIVVAASYQYLKNPIGLVEAVLMMTEEERDKIVIDWYGRAEVTKGDTKAYNESIEKILKYNIQDVIHLNETTKNIYNIMNEADIVALFSKLEGLPNSICEGMMLGKPIIMTRVSDYNLLVDDKNGFLCDWDNPISIKNALIKAANLSEVELFQMGKKSKEKAEKYFTAKTIVNQWINLLE